MAQDQAAKRYAQAAFALAKESGTVAAWRADIEDLAYVLSDSDAAAWFASSKIPLEERSARLERVLDIQPFALNLGKLLLLRGRSRMARQLAVSFNAIADADEGIVDAEVITAVELDASQREAIEQQISAASGKRIRLRARVDPAVIGGIVVRVGDRLIDGSVRTRLRLLRKELAGA